MKVNDTLILEDRMSQTIKAVQVALDHATASTKIAQTEMEAVKKAYGDTSIEAAKATLAWSKHAQQTINLENKLNKLKQEEEKVNKELEKTAQISKKAQTGMFALGSAIGTLGANLLMQAGQMLSNSIGQAIETASDLVEVQNVVDVTFGNNAKTINEWSQNALTQFGLNELSAKKFTSTLGAMMKSSGITGDALVEMSTKMAGLAGDMASFYNLDPEEAFTKIRAGISGESEPLKQIGIDMTEATLKADAMALGFGDSLAKLTQQQKILVRYHSLLRQTADSQGDAAETMYTFANQQRILSQNWGKLTAKIAEGFLPALTSALIFSNKLINSLIDLIDTTKELISKAIEPMAKAFIIGLAAIATYASVSFGVFVARATWAATTNAALWLWTWGQTLWVTRQTIAANIIAAAQSTYAWIKGIPELLRYQATLLKMAITSKFAGNISFGAALKSAAGWALANIPLMATIAVVGLLIYAFVKLNKSVEQVLNFCIDKFFDFTQAALSNVRSIAQAIDSVFKSNLTENIDKLSKKAEGARAAAKKGTHNLQQWLDKASKFDVTSSITNSMGLDKFSDGGALKTKQQGKIELKEEDIELLSQLATRDWTIRSQTLAPNIQFGAVTVNENADIGQFINELNNSVAEMVNSNANVGVGK